MTKQTEIAEHLGISQQAVSKTLSKMGIEWRDKSLDEIRLAYISRLREVAAGHASIDGEYDLNKERVLTERVDRELKQYQLAEKKGQLVPTFKASWPMCLPAFGKSCCRAMTS